jgi:hypothetical protein
MYVVFGESLRPDSAIEIASEDIGGTQRRIPCRNSAMIVSVSAMFGAEPRHNRA